MSDVVVRRTISCCLLAGAMMLGLARAEEISAPSPVANKEVTAYVAVQNIPKLIDQIEKLALQVAPAGQYKPGDFAAALGVLVGDPKLASLGKNPLVAMVFQVPAGYDMGKSKFPFAVFVPVSAENPASDALKQKEPDLKTFFDNGVLIVAPSDDLLAKAKAARADYDKIATDKFQGDARLYINVASLIDTFGPILKMGLHMKRDELLKDITGAAEKINKVGLKPETVTQLTYLLFNGIEGLMDQTDAVQLDVTLNADSLLIEPTFAAKGGTLLAELFQGNAPAQDPNLQSFLTPGFITLYMNSDMAARETAFKKVQAAIAADPTTAGLANSEVMNIVKDAIDAVGGEMIYSIGGGQKGLEMTVALQVKDEAKYMSVVEREANLLGKDSVLGKFYEQLGMKFEMSLEKNERTHAGINVSRFKTTMEMPNMPPDLQKMIKNLIPAPETAIVKGYSLTSSDPTALDSMIDKTLKGDFTPSAVTLKSLTAFGKGKNLYMDYDLIAYLKFAMSLVPAGPAAGMFNQLKGGDPMLFSYAQGNGRAKVQMQIPLAPIMQMGKMFGEMGQGMPAVKPPKAEGQF